MVGGSIDTAAAFGRAAARAKHMSDILFRVRLGHLSPDWRNNLRSVAAQMGVSGPQADAEAAAILDLQTLPIAPWEPHQSDWRGSLDSWYFAARQNAADRYVNTVRLDVEQLTASDPVVALIASGQLAEKILKSVAPQDCQADTTRQVYMQAYIAERTSLTGSYLAGLAAGGEDVDWRSWYRTEIMAWPADHPSRHRCEFEIADRTHEKLPQYWAAAPG